MKILLVEDDKETAHTVRDELKHYFVVDLAYTGEDGEYKIQANEYDVVIIDYMLPDMNGIELCTRIREANNLVPILMLTGTSAVPTIVGAFDAGVDDYVVKPFNFDELLARIRALMRRPRNLVSKNILKVDNLTFDVNKKVVMRDGVAITLRRKELHLLEYLMRNAGQIITREMIMNHVWDSDNDSFTNMIDVHIKFLRDAVDRKFNKKLIKTVHGLGYKMEG